MAEKKPARPRKTAATKAVKGAGAKAGAAKTGADAADAPPAGPAAAGHRPAGQLRCPRCSAPMKEFTHLGVTLDGCTGCEGLFLDAGELEQVLQKEYPEAMGAAADYYESQIALVTGGEEGEVATGGVEVRKTEMGSFFRSLFRKLHGDGAS